MPWCHTCRIQYHVELDECPECAGPLTDAPAPERRLARLPSADSGWVVAATLAPEQALFAAGRLDERGIPSQLRDVGDRPDEAHPKAVQLLVCPGDLGHAIDVLRGRAARRSRAIPFGSFLFIVTAAAIFLSGAIIIARWVLTGSPIPR